MKARDGSERVRAAVGRRERGDGIVLEPLCVGHAEQFAGLVRANRDHLGPWMNWVWAPFPVESAVAEIERMATGDVGPWSMPYAIEHSGRMIGFAQLFGIRFFLGVGEVSYWIDQGYSGQGIVTWAVNQLCQVAFDDLGLHRLELRCATGNMASRAIASKCGFTPEGVLRDAWRVQEQRQDLIIHARLATERT